MQVLQVSVSTLRAAARPLTGGGARGQLGAGQRAVSPGPWTRLVRPHRYHTYMGEIQAERSHFYKLGYYGGDISLINPISIRVSKTFCLRRA